MVQSPGAALTSWRLVLSSFSSKFSSSADTLLGADQVALASLLEVASKPSLLGYLFNGLRDQLQQSRCPST